MDFISSFSMEVLSKSMDGLAERHKAIASNLANVETPGYQRQGVQFENALQKAIQKHNARTKAVVEASNGEALPMMTNERGHINLNPVYNDVADVTPQVFTDKAHSRYDQNGVDVESEMVDLAKNTEHYSALSTLESRMFRSIRGVINNNGS